MEKVKFVNNDDILKVALEAQKMGAFRLVLSYQTAKAFLFRDMDDALKYADMYYKHFLASHLFVSYFICCLSDISNLLSLASIAFRLLGQN